MDQLIEALQILRKYGNPTHPFQCEHDVLFICGIDPADVTPEDRQRLDDLGFWCDQDDDQFISTKYGSA